MSLRTKLVISFTLLLLLVIVTVGLIATRSVESILVAQIDRTLAGFVGRGPGPGPHPEPPDDELFRPIAEVLVDGEGTVVESRPSGFSDDPDPLPDVSDLAGQGGNGEPALGRREPGVSGCDRRIAR